MTCECMHRVTVNVIYAAAHVPCSQIVILSVIIHVALLLQDGWSSLMIASEKGHLDVVMALIGAGAEVSLTNKVHTV